MPVYPLCLTFVTSFPNLFGSSFQSRSLPITRATSYQRFQRHSNVLPYVTPAKHCHYVPVAVTKSTPASADVTIPVGTFHQLYKTQVPLWLLDRLVHLGFTIPTPIQYAVLQHTLSQAPDAPGEDVVIHAQTGSGKTLAYLLPAISAVVPERSCVQALIVVPTQELGMQVYKLLRRLTSAYHGRGDTLRTISTDQALSLENEASHNLRTNVSDGLGADNDIDDANPDADDDDASVTFDDGGDDATDGTDTDEDDSFVDDGARTASFPVLPMLNQAGLRRQKLQLRQTAPRIVVGNPRRIAELENSGRLRLDLLKVLVVDEFDACLADTSTTAALQTILAVRNRERDRQTILASATVPQQRHFLRQCVRQRWTRPDIRHVWLDKSSGVRVPLSLTHAYALCDGKKKVAALRALINRFNDAAVHAKNGDSDADGSPSVLSIRAMVFVMPSRDVDSIVNALNRSLVAAYGGTSERPVEGIHNDMLLAQRKDAVRRFSSGEAHILIGTDVAARGLDFPDVSHIFHFDLPADADGYLHRAGRAGRQGRPGTSVVMVTRGEEFVVRRTANTLGIDFEKVGR